MVVTTYILAAGVEAPHCKGCHSAARKSIVRLYMVVTTYKLAAGVDRPPCKGCHFNTL